MVILKFNSKEEAQAASSRVFQEAEKLGLFSSGTTSYAEPLKKEFWEVPVLPGFESFFTEQEKKISEIIDQGYFAIKPSQGKIMLHRMGLLESVEAMIQNSPDVELRLFWEYALTWELDNSYIQAMAASIGLTSEDVEAFFTQANEIR